MKPVRLLFILLFTAVSLGAQEPAVRIYHAEGVDFAVVLRGERVVFPADSVFREGINLERSGVVHTGAGTLLEMQLSPSGTLVKLSENTSLCYNGIDGSGNYTELVLLYGRIRVVSGIYNTGGTAYTPALIRAGNVSVRIENGDLGLDYTVDPGIQYSAPVPVLRICTFRGRADIYQYGRDGANINFGGAQFLTVANRESLKIDINPPYTYAERKSLDRDMLVYWNEHNFSGSSPLPMPDTEIAGLIETPPVYVPSPEPPLPAQIQAADSALVFQPGTVQEKIVRARSRQKNIVLIAGLTLTLGSFGAQLITSGYDLSVEGTARNIHKTAYATLGLGALITLAGILYSPLPPHESAPPASR